MKRSILLSLMVIGAVAALITAATSATFTDQVTSTANTFTAGTVNLTADGNCPDAGTTTGCSYSAVNFTMPAGGLMPGQSVHHDYTIANAGSLNFTYATTTTPHAPGSGANIWTCNSSAVSVVVTGGDDAAGGGSINGSGATTGSKTPDTVTVTVSMPLAADNSCQGATGTLDVVFTATQAATT